MELKFSQDVERVAWGELARVFKQAPLGKRYPARLEAAFRNSAHCCFVYHQTRLIAAGRALSDGVSHAAIYDVVVLPEYQRQDVGRRVREVLMKMAIALFKNPE